MSEKKQKQIMIDLSKAESYFRGGGMTIINKNFHFLLDKNFMEINKSLASDDKEEKRIWKNQSLSSKWAFRRFRWYPKNHCQNIRNETRFRVILCSQV